MNVNKNSINQQEQTLEQFILSRQQQWSDKIKDINKKFKTILELQDVLTEIYSLRQDIEDYRKQVLVKCAGLSRDYKKRYAELYNAYKTSAQIKYNSDAAINSQIAAQLADAVYTMDIMNHHSDFLNESIKTIDSLIFGIKHRIDIENLLKIGALK